jgi:hypothetical protein
MTLYTVAECLAKIAHYQVAMKRDMMQPGWYRCCEMSIATWQEQLERVIAK